MIDFSSFDDSVIMARGKYATVRSEHEDAKKRAQMLCGALSATSAQILRAVQPDNDAPINAAEVREKIEICQSLIEQIGAAASEIAEMAEQRAALKAEAWAKPARK